MNTWLKNHANLLISLILLGLTLGVYWPVQQCQFINYDDDKYVTDNSHVRSGLTLSGLAWAFTSDSTGNWHPLTWLSHMLDCQCFGLSPRDHHRTNLLIHALNTLLLFGVLKTLTGRPWPSAVAAALFACHPLHVESVAWVAERKDVLSAFFFLLTVGIYGRYVAEQREGNVACARASWLYGLALLCFVLGLMCKPMVVTLPFVLLLLDYWPLHRTLTWNRAIVEKVPFFILTLLFSIITLVAQHRGGAVASVEAIPLDSRCLNALAAYLRYTIKLVWPDPLAVIYPYQSQWPIWLLSWASLVLLITTVATLVWRRAAPYLIVGWLWFVGMLVPVIGLIQVGEQAMADRYTYLPSVGLFIAACWGLPHLLQSWRARSSILAALTLVALVGSAALTRAQLRHWQNSITLFEHAVAVTSANPVAHATLGSALLSVNRLEEAIQHLTVALEMDPNRSSAHNNLGIALTRVGKFEEAISHYEAALKLAPQSAEIHFNLANVLNPGFQDANARHGVTRDRSTDAARSQEHYRIALRLAPDWSEAQINWGNLEFASGGYAEAILHYQQALKLDPVAAPVYCNLAKALAAQGKLDEAETQFAKASRLNPQSLSIQQDWAGTLIRSGHTAAAIPHYREALRLAPDSVVILNNLAWVLATDPDPQVRDGATALALASRAVELTRQQDPGVLGTLDAAYAEAGLMEDAIRTVKRVRELATRSGQDRLAATAAKRLECYRLGKAYHAALSNNPTPQHPPPLEHD